MKNRYRSLTAKTICALWVFFVSSAYANPVYPGDTGIWAIPSKQIAVPNGYCISETILTLHNVSVFGGDDSGLFVYLMPDKANGFYGLSLKDNFSDNCFALYGLPLAEFEPDNVTNGILRIRLSSLTNMALNPSNLNTPSTVQFADGSSFAISPANLQFMDYLGSSPSVAFGFYSRGFTFSSMSLTVMCRAYDTPQGTRMFLLNSGNLHPPVLEPLPPMPAQEGQEINFTLTATDPDNNSLSFYGLNLPHGAVLSGNQFTWTPSWMQAGDYSIRFIVSDGKNSDYKDMFLTVLNVDQPPIFSPLANQTGQVRKLLTFPVAAEDPEGNPVTIIPVNLPNGSVFQSNQFSWIPGTAQTGAYDITFIASDGSLQSQITIRIEISPASTTSGTYFVF